MVLLDYSDRIDRFINGQLTDDEQVQFRKELSANSELQQEIQFHQNMKAAILEEEVLKFRQILDAAHSDYEQRNVVEHPSRSRFSQPYRIVAAVAAIVITSGLIAWYVLQGGMSNREIYEMYFKPYKVTMNVRSTRSTIQEDIRNALVLYEKGNYAEALPVFKKVINGNPSNHAVNLYAGISYMEIQQFTQATNAFERIIEHKNNLFVEQAEWYAALCYLVSDQPGKAKKQFTRIVSREGYYTDPAKEILNKMK